MAIATAVQDFQQQAIMQNQENNSPELLSFNKKLGDAAYVALKSKFPNLMPLIVTFKILESDVENGNGAGAFIVQYGNDVVYVPVIMTDGNITSCEMIYNKQEGSLFPLLTATAENILAKKITCDPKLVDNYLAEDTREVYKRMLRPPMMSNRVIAALRGVYGLPDRAKAILANYCKQHPVFLAKVASFYPVDVLASHLAVKSQTAPAVSKEPSSSNIIKLAGMTKEAIQKLSAEDKKDLAEKGYAVKVKEIKDAPDVISMKQLPVDLVTKADLTEISDHQGAAGVGNLLYLSGSEIIGARCLVLGDVIITDKGHNRWFGNRVLAGFREGISEKDLKEFGGQSIRKTEVKSNKGGRVFICYPVKSGGYGHDKRLEFFADEQTEKRDVDGTVTLSRFGHDLFVFTPVLSYGYVDSLRKGNCTDCSVREDDLPLIVPSNSLVIKKPKDESVYISAISTLFNLFIHTGMRLRVFGDGAGVSLNDFSMKKTAHFKDEAELVDHVISKYNFTKEAVDCLLQDKEVLVLKKVAFVNPSPVEQGSQSQQPVESSPLAGPQTMPVMGQPGAAVGEEVPPEINEALLSGAAELEDPEIFNTGMLAALAGNEDIKILLVDMVPEFENTITNIGKVILLFSIRKNKLEEYYGMEDFGTLLNNCRKIFRILGEIVQDLRQYMNMNA